MPSIRSRILAHMRASKEGACTAEVLAKELAIDLQTVRHSLKSALADALVVGVRSDNARRAYALASAPDAPPVVDEQPKTRRMATAFLDRPIGRLAAQLSCEPDHLRIAAYKAHARGGDAS